MGELVVTQQGNQVIDRNAAVNADNLGRVDTCAAEQADKVEAVGALGNGAEQE